MQHCGTLLHYFSFRGHCTWILGDKCYSISKNATAMTVVKVTSLVVEHRCTMRRAWCIIRVWCRWMRLVLKSMSSTLKVALHYTMPLPMMLTQS